MEAVDEDDDGVEDDEDDDEDDEDELSDDVVEAAAVDAVDGTVDELEPPRLSVR